MAVMPRYSCAVNARSISSDPGADITDEGGSVAIPIIAERYRLSLSKARVVCELAGIGVEARP
jgi:hypothetical protein